MEVKKAQPLASSKPAELSTEKQLSAVEFVGEVKAELKRITWTSKEELRLYTKMVVATTFVLGLGLYVIDIFIQSFLNGMGVIFRLFS